MNATIFALSSGRPPAAIGLIRVSGPQAAEALRTLAREVPKSRRATLTDLFDPVDRLLLDRALILFFPGPDTVTGEDLAELHCHGGRAVVEAVLVALGRLPGFRSAEPGEFTRRAFENGRIDLSEAEGLADLLAAETASQHRAALAMASGHFSLKILKWQDELLGLAAMTEAALDFSDEDDVPDAGIESAIADGLAALAAAAAAELARPSAERLRDGIRVVIAGPPNAGKSTLLNALAGREAAIVSDIAGTTRDRIDVPVALGGVAYLLSDTAGLRGHSDDAIEAIGMERAEAAIEEADILLWLGAPADAPRADAIRIAAQADRLPAPSGADLAVSALTGQGMTELVAHIDARARRLIPAEGDYALGARQRHGVTDFQAALAAAAQESDLLLVAEHLRAARIALDRLTGRAGTEDMLDALFGRFCIGK